MFLNLIELCVLSLWSENIGIINVKAFPLHPCACAKNFLTKNLDNILSYFLLVLLA